MATPAAGNLVNERQDVARGPEGLQPPQGGDSGAMGLEMDHVEPGWLL